MIIPNDADIGQARSAYDELGVCYAAIRDLSNDINTKDATIAYQRGRISDLERNLDLTRAEKQALQGRISELVACGKCEPSLELEAVQKQFGAFFREVLKMPCPIWLEDCLPAIARQVEALRVAVDRAAPPERIRPSPGVAWAKVFLDIAKSDSTKTCGGCEMAKEFYKYKAFYDAYEKIRRSKVYGCKCCAWRGELPDPTVKRDAQVIAPGAADFGGP